MKRAGEEEQSSLFSSGRSFWENSVRETQSAEANFGPLKGEKDDVYRAVRTINAMESLKVMPVRYEQFLIANM